MKSLLDKLNSHAGEFNVSLIVPIENESFDLEVNKNRVKEAIRDAGEKIIDRKTDYDFLIDRMLGLFEHIDWHHPMKGIGMFVSPSVAEWIYFSNPVTEKIMVGDLFETRDLVFEMTHTMKFWLLVMSMNKTRLFRGEGRKLNEIQDDHFPTSYVEEFDFDQTPSRMRSTQGVDTTQVQEGRKKEYFRKVDSFLGLFMKTGKQPLIIAGVNDVMALFREVTLHEKYIIGRVHGNFDYATDS